MTAYGVTTHDGRRNSRARAVAFGVTELDLSGKPIGGDLFEVVVPLGPDFRDRLINAQQRAQAIAYVLTRHQPALNIWRCACRHRDHFGPQPASHAYLSVHAGDATLPKVGAVCVWCYEHHQEVQQLAVTKERKATHS